MHRSVDRRSRLLADSVCLCLPAKFDSTISKSGCFDAKFPDERNVFFVTMVMVTGDVARFGSFDLMRRMGKCIPYGRSPSTLGDCALDLITGGCRSPEER